ncbi:hypothetical protein PIB30_089650, partial [Stylosanthes scabra]|nr:hypothetical protein [Stylosanthes scabra]
MGQAGRVLAVGGLQEAHAGQQEEQGILDGWIASYRGLHHVRGHQRADVELGRTPTQSEVFVRTHTRKEDRSWVDKRSEDVNEERQAIIDAGGPEPPPLIDEDALRTRIAGGHKRGRIYGMGVVPSHKYPHLFADPEDDDIASGPPDLREQVTLLNREIADSPDLHPYQELDEGFKPYHT